MKTKTPFSPKQSTGKNFAVATWGKHAANPLAPLPPALSGSNRMTSVPYQKSWDVDKRCVHKVTCRSTSAGAVEPTLRNAARALGTPNTLYTSLPRPWRIES